MSQPFLIELGCEEIPARFFPQLSDEFRTAFETTFKQNRLSYGKMTVFATYRRLGLLVDALEDSQPDLDELIKGPPASIGVSSDGQFLPAALGFAKKLGCNAEQLSIETIAGNDYVMAKRFQKGAKTEVLLQTLIPQVIQSLKLPIAMRWGEGIHTFIRPIQWILCLYGRITVPVTCFGITSGSYTYGHRFLTSNSTPNKSIWGIQLKIESPENYASTLETQGKVKANPDIRKEDLVQQLNTYTKDIEPGLLNEVLYLVEWPTVLKGQFSTDFLNLPSEVLVDCMTTNQKYFPLRTNGQLTSSYLVAAENVTPQSETNILKGNNNVLRARLNDMKFFWEEDQKHPLEAYLEKLKQMTYQKNMGTLFDKVQRITAISNALVSHFECHSEQTEILETAHLCKSDLATHLVIESPVLQGVMGRYYAQLQKQPESVALGIEQHYWPRFSDDKLPIETTGIIVGIADRLDTLASTFETGYIPSGSQDPLGARRTLFGLFRILLAHPCDSSLSKLYEIAYAQLNKGTTSKPKLKEFTLARLKSLLVDDQNLPYDCVDATLHLGLESLKATQKLARQLGELQSKDKSLYKELTESAVRVSKLASKAPQEGLVNESLFTMDEEKYLWVEIGDIRNQLETLSFEDSPFEILGKLNPILIRFFEKVLVMDPDLKIQHNRLALLKNLHDLYYSKADFTKLV